MNIEYKLEKGVYKTVCPHRLTLKENIFLGAWLKVGSLACTDGCKHYRGQNDKYVKCEKKQ